MTTGDELTLTDAASGAGSNGTPQEQPATQRELRAVETCVRELLDEAFDRFADDVAIRCQDTQFSYAELDRAADRLTGLLLEQELGGGSVVAVLTSDRLALIAALLATLRAGCVFAPLDPGSPRQRLGRVMSLLTPDLVLVTDERADVESLFAQESPRVVCCGSGESMLRPSENGNGHPRPAGRLRAPFGSDEMCYVYFTSGSTGTPKGIAGCLRGLSHFIRWELRKFDVRPGWRFSQFVVPTFDPFLRDVFVPLCSGGTICVPPDADMLLDAENAARWISDNRIEFIHTVPSVFSTIVNVEGEPDAFDSLRFVLLSGEALPAADVRKWREAHGSRTTLVNLYGPTETTMTKFCHVVEEADLEREFIPIGKPMEGAQALVISDGQPCPPGMVGEIYIRTPYRTLGYYKQPELTDEVFVQNPFTDDPADLVYKTGDLGRQLRDGNFQFCGRKDRQLKIRGNRVEPGEIEAALAEHPELKQVAVVAWEESPGDLRLAAYVVPVEGAAPVTSGLREHLQSRLPEYMIPSTFTTLDNLPLTPNGKINRKGLPRPDRKRPQLKTEYVEPRDDDERQLAAIWCEVLKIDKVGIHDNFFELGGHSLLATQVIARAREHFQVEVPLRELFNAQTIAGLAALAKSAEKGALAPRITRDIQQKAVPLSFAQERLWFFDQLMPQSPLYNISQVVRVSGPLDLDALRQTVNEIVRRHEVLRTTFPSIHGDPLQVVSSKLELDVPLQDLRHLPAAELEEEAVRLAQTEARRPFDLWTGPLIRVMAIRQEDEEHVLLLTVHHIAFDAWSGGVFLRELGTLYDAFSRGEASPLSELPLQYTDFAGWQRGWLEGEVLDQQMAYWKNQLADVPVLELPTDRPRPAERSFRGATHRFRFSPELTQAVRSFGRERGATPYMTLLAAFQTLLARYSGQEDIAVGSPIAGRQRAELENLIGFFVNTLVLRTDLSGDPTFDELLEQVREHCLDAYARQDLPFEKLVVELQPQRNLNHSPLFQVSLVVQNAPTPAIAVPGGLRLAPVQLERDTARFELTLEIVESPEHFSGSFRYNADLFDQTTIERMTGHLTTLLERAVANPNERLSRISLLGDDERARLLVDWNRTKPLEPPACVHTLFEQQAEKTPDRCALLYNGAELTYRELDRQANQLAHHLQSLGVGPDVFVGILTERSIEAFVAILGVLKAGGAYVPLDPRAPESRLQYQVDEIKAPVVLVQQRLAARLGPTRARVLYLDADWDSVAANPSNAPESGAQPQNAAYVIFTSGSTGQPKGVVVEHRQICHYARGFLDRLEIEPGMRFGAVQPLTVDASMTTVYGALLTGGCLHIFSEDDALDAQRLEAEFARTGIDVLKIAPTHLATLQDAASSPERVLPQKRLILGGEVSKRKWLTDLVKLVPQCEVFNHYGPTETTVGVLTFPAGELNGETGSVEVPIGRPLAGTRAYVLDEQLQPVPIGLPGELYIGGALVTRGYLNSPQQTAQRYLPDPFGDEPGARLYKTGDRCRWLPGGSIDFLGRADHQIKIRGFRIEPGEIEAMLANHAGVRSVLVMGREDEPGDVRLVAYVVTESDRVSVEELRAFAELKLPSHMVPVAFVLLDEFPRSAHGKVDRNALPAPERSRTGLRAEFVAPRTANEIKLAEIICEVLRLDKIGIHDNFFELGGHSLLATQVTARIRDAFGVELPLRKLFELHCIADLIPAIEIAELATQSKRIHRGIHGDEPIPLSFAQERLWFLDQLHPGSPSYNISTAIRVRGRFDVDALQRAINEIVRRHEALRTRLPSVEGRPVQEVLPALKLNISVKDLQSLPEEEREAEARRLAIELSGRPFDLAAGPLLRTEVMRLGEEDHVISFGVHHIVFDGWSRGVFIRELSILYEAFSHGRPSTLPELSLQYSDFTTWQRNWLSGDVLDSELAFWVKQLEGTPHSLELPTDRPRPAIQTINGAQHPFWLSAELTEEIKGLGRENGATTFMTLLAAFQVLLHRYSGVEDVLVGTPIAGRTTRQTEDLIGLFINTLVLRGNLTGDPSFEEFLGRVRNVTLDAYAHQVVPFEQLLRTVQPVRDMSRSPLFQVMFVLQNVPPPEAQLPGVDVESIRFGRETAKFDINLAMFEVGDRIRGTCEFNTDLFDLSTIERMMSHFERLLEAVVRDSGQPVSRIGLMSEAETTVVVDEWNPSDEAASDSGLLVDAFECQVETTPAAIAVVDDGREFTYQELNLRANRLAHYLQEGGVGPDVCVGLCVERSAEMIVGMLGILKAGGAYVPLDADYPRERLAYMVQSSRLAVVLTQESLLEALPECEIPFVCLDRDRDEIAQCSEAQPVCRAAPENLAYAIFTSGSTGQPNAVQIPHSALANYSEAAGRRYRLSSDDRVLQFASISFDISVEEVFATLTHGAALVLRTDAMLESITDFFLQCKEQQITVLDLPTAFWHECCHAVVAEEAVVPDCVRLTIIGGERVEPSLVDDWQRQVGSRVEFVNTYGPTETTVAATLHDLTRDTPAEAPREARLAEVPIGKPFAGAETYVLDNWLNPVPMGVPGELYIGGAGLARGYFHRPDLTAERFVPSPFQRGARLYKTGDRCRWLADGNLQFLGRADHQVKIRGFRIEPGEIETVLCDHPSVAQAAVVPWEDRRGGVRLVAYLVGDEVSSRELRRFLKSRLPVYMVPSDFVVLDALPLTPGGKIDRAALPSVGRIRPDGDKHFVPPQTELEQRLAEIFCEVLDVERMGIDENFFEFGGHSLLATQLVSRVRSNFGIELALRRLFESPTIEELSLVVEEALLDAIESMSDDDALAISEDAEDE